MLGPNGAGKSTLMRAIMGLVADRGSVRFRGADVPRAQPDVGAAALGSCWCRKGAASSAPMTVAENLELGAYLLSDKAEFARRHERVLSLFPRLQERLHQIAGSLSGGEQQMLAVGRALMADPKLLLLDEPSLGLAPRVTEEILGTLGAAQPRGPADRAGRAEGAAGAQARAPRLSACRSAASRRDRSAHRQVP